MALKLKTFPAVTVEVAGQRKRISDTSVYVYSFSVQSLRTNTGYQYIGDETVSSSNGHEIKPSGQAEIEPPPGSSGGREPAQIDLKEFYVDSTTDGAEFRIAGWIRV